MAHGKCGCAKCAKKRKKMPSKKKYKNETKAAFAKRKKMTGPKRAAANKKAKRKSGGRY